MLRACRILLIFLAFGLPVTSHSNECASSFALLSSADLGEFSNFIRVLETRSTQFHRPSPLRTLSESPPFLKFLEKRGIHDVNAVSTREKTQWLKLYLREFFRDINESLPALRDRALRKSLAAHGYHFAQDMPAKTALKTLSRENLERLLPKDGVVSQPIQGMEEIEALIEKQVVLRPVHYSSLTHVPENSTPFLSAEQLERLGIANFGLNTKGFNRWIGSSDNLYFFPNFDTSVSTTVPVISKTLYGAHGVMINADVAKDEAWVSAFVMYPSELVNSTSQTSTETFLKIQNANPKPQFNTTAIHEGREFPELLREARDSLHKLDFTAEDFTFLVRRHLLYQLSVMRQNSKEYAAAARDYASAVADLRNGRNIQALISTYAFPSIGGWVTPERGFEVKIPVMLSTGDVVYKPPLPVPPVVP